MSTAGRATRLPAWVPRACARSDNVATLMLGVAQLVSAAPEPKAKNERRRGVAERHRGQRPWSRGGETQDQPRGTAAEAVVALCPRPGGE